MPRLYGVRERRHQPFWDTAFRADGPPAVPLAPRISLFGNANVGNLARTNLQVAGQFASDQTYVILSIRLWMFFDDGPVEPVNLLGEGGIVSNEGV